MKNAKEKLVFSAREREDSENNSALQKGIRTDRVYKNTEYYTYNSRKSPKTRDHFLQVVHDPIIISEVTPTLRALAP